MDRYLVLLLEDLQDHSRVTNPAPSLLAFDLRNNSTQEVKLDESVFQYWFHCFEKSTFSKYRENQIIIYTGELNFMVRITIESFERTLFHYDFKV